LFHSPDGSITVDSKTEENVLLKGAVMELLVADDEKPTCSYATFSQSVM
jgi:hypothetical protein